MKYSIINIRIRTHGDRNYNILKFEFNILMFDVFFIK